VKKPIRFRRLINLLLVLPMACTIFAQASPQRTQAIPGEMNPFEVKLFRNADYSVPIGTWRLAPGMRLAKLPNIKPVPRSILIGAKVSVFLFPSRDFSSTLPVWNQSLQGFVELNFYLIPYFHFRTSTAKMFPDESGKNSIIIGGGINKASKIVTPKDDCSIVIHRRDIDDIVGVFLETADSAGAFGKFYPLAEKAADPAIVYEAIPAKGPFILTIMAGGSGTMSIYPSTSPPNPNNLDVFITAPYQTLKIPEQNAKDMRFELKSHGIDREISSMKLFYKGPFPPQAYDEAVRVRAPSAPDAPSFDPAIPAGNEPPVQVLSGTWESSIGTQYVFSQTGNTFTWTAAGLGQQGAGTLSGKKVTAQWTGSDGSGSAAGQITKLDPAGAALRIEWDNGIVFFRQNAPPAQAIADVVGIWKGPMGLTYTFTQSSSQFAWTVNTTGEKGKGAISGTAVTAQWSGPLGSGSAKGKITATDAGGRATRIEWDNGVIFKR